MAGTHGHSTALSGSTSGSIAGVLTRLGIGPRTRDMIDVSTFQSTNKAREFIAGMRDAGELTLEMLYDGSASGDANTLDTAYEAATSQTWTVTLPDTSTFAATGIISSLSYDVTLDDAIKMTCTIKLSGDETFTDVA